MFDKVLVPIDGSRHAHAALQTALELAEVHGSELEILHVTSYSETYAPMETEPIGGGSGEASSPPEWIDEYMTKLRANDEKMLSQALEEAKKLHPGLKIASKLLWGRPGKVIVSEAEEGGFDLVIIGSRGLGGLAGLVLGSVSQHVVNEARVPVLVVK